ncbi:sensor domain-containing diguanylate cyclase [Ureibacillus chungkukjangi]|uniref:Diguanylate cyclase with GAF sensor n=1 Tax=Ureibacillus chungkukjangi TaxID=1202712 RepID=A0A318U3X2_9BACL|nr:sensor domain-containing diguanylate cyclase [Ureibacillus chungkukjangi]MCM3387453.1 sensor domain-containing diguanylate cyclase [Ureibacillus chungkukjangi]PYF09065.1 diguanylate cyclase with GAF sensor [Ureibacillus chungkukjangi]
MREHREILTNIKSDLLSLCIDSMNQRNGYDEYMSLIQNSLKQYFDIDKCCFLLYECESLKPFNIKSSIDIDLNSITWSDFTTHFSQKKLIDLPECLSHIKEFNLFSKMLLLKTGQFGEYCILLLQETPKWTAFTKSEFFENFVDTAADMLKVLCKNIEILQNEKQYRKLYNMTDLFHSTMDIDLILENVLITIQDNFPNFNVELILSNDHDRQTKVHIKPFDYLSERPSAIEAFVSGKIIVEQAVEMNRCLLNAPMKGRQAIYGILQVSAPIFYVFSKTEEDFIRMLAHASGNALENAKLYHQSHRLISDLQLINETSHRLNMKLDSKEMFMFLHKQLMKSFQPMEVCFVLKSDSELKLTEASTELFDTEEGSIYINHAANHFKNSQEPLFIADCSRLIGKELNYNSMMAIPMIVEQRINGFSIVLHRDSYFFSFDSFKLMQSLIHHSSLAIANSILRNKLQEMVDHDHLTKLHTRSYLDRFVESSLESDSSGMFLLIDIDNFKHVNDTYGHQVGDEVLVQIADQLKKVIGTRGICARWGGEELAVYVPNILVAEVEKLASQIVESVPVATNPTVTVSAGLITWNTKQRPEFQSIFLHADTALYNAKSTGKNKFSIFNESMLFLS